MVKTTVFWGALALVLAPSLISAAGGESPGDCPPKKSPPSQRVHVPIEGVEFYAGSIRLTGTKVTATGDVRARLERFPRVEVRAARLEYRVGGDKVKLHEPTWMYSVGEEESRRLKVSAETATFRIENETVAARSIRVETEDGQVSLEAESGTWRPKSNSCVLESVQGLVFTATDERGRGSEDHAHFGVKIRRATLRLSPDLALDEMRLEDLSGVEKRDHYVFEAAGGVLRPAGGKRPAEARLTAVKVVAPNGHTIDCEKLVYRLPAKGER